MDADKKSPNPNVLFESGYATAFLGEERVIFLLDSQSGSVGECPFDIEHRRITLFDLNSKNSKKKVVECILASIKIILEKNPPKTLILHEIERTKDIQKLFRLLEKFDLDEVDSCLCALPQTLEGKMIEYYNYLLIEQRSPSNRYFYDKRLESFFQEILICLSELDHMLTCCYDYSNKGDTYYFVRSRAPEGLFDAIEKKSGEARTLINKFIYYLHEFYQDVDIHKTNCKARQFDASLEEYSKNNISC
jgi:hypothetical protein